MTVKPSRSSAVPQCSVWRFSCRSSPHTEPDASELPPLGRWPEASEPTPAATWIQADAFKNTGIWCQCGASKLLLISALPPGDDGNDAGRCHRQRQVSPVSNEVGQQRQEHVAHAPRQTHDSASERTVLHVRPLNT